MKRDNKDPNHHNHVQLLFQVYEIDHVIDDVFLTTKK